MLHKCEQSLQVFMPGHKEILLRGVLVTAQSHGYFKTVGVKIVEVLHTWTEKEPTVQSSQNTHTPSVSSTMAWLSSMIRQWPLVAWLCFNYAESNFYLLPSTQHLYLYFLTNLPQSWTTVLRWQFLSDWQSGTFHTWRFQMTWFRGHWHKRWPET